MNETINNLSQSHLVFIYSSIVSMALVCLYKLNQIRDSRQAPQVAPVRCGQLTSYGEPCFRYVESCTPHHIEH